MTNGNSRYVIFIVLFCLFIAPSARADEFRIVPSVAAKDEYNSNIYVTPTDPRRDFITTLSPGIALVKRNERLDTGAQVRLDSRYYGENQDLNAIDQTYQGNLKYRLTPNFGLAADAGYFIDSRADRDLATTGLILSTLRRERVKSSLATDYQFSEVMALTMSYAYGKDTYERKVSDFQSHDVNIGLVRDFSKYFPAVKGMINFGYGSYDIGGFRTNSMMTTLGMSRNFNEIWSINVSGGARYTEAQFPVPRLQMVAPGVFQVVQDTQADDGWGWVAQGALNYTGERGNSSLTYTRDVRPASGYNATVEMNALAINLSYRFTHEFSFSLYGGYYTNKSGQLASSANSIDTQTLGITPRIRYEFSKDVAVDLSYDYINSENKVTNLQAERHLVSLLLTVQHAFFE